MTENENMHSPMGEMGSPAQEYRKRASEACASGDGVLGMHLYLAAYEEALGEKPEPDATTAVESLKEAWELSCSLGERAMAEYILEKLEPFLDGDELPFYSNKLQSLAIDQIGEMGMVPEDFKEFAQRVARDLFGADLADATVLSLKLPATTAAGQSTPSNPKKPTALTGAGEGSKELFAPSRRLGKPAKRPAEEPTPEIVFAEPPLTFKDLVGYTRAIRSMNRLGIGLNDDPDFSALVEKLNARHGYAHRPASQTILLRAPAREDASFFARAVVNEIGLPCVRMNIDDSPGGMPMLCVYCDEGVNIQANSAGVDFGTTPCLIILEDLDLWEAPPTESEMADGIGGLMMTQFSRSARDTLHMIRAAADHPDIHLLATASSAHDIDPFFLDLIEPFDVVEINMPDAAERAEIWMDILREHPSLRPLDRACLVKYSEGLARVDLYMAARDAVDQAYRDGLEARRYIPISHADVYSKLANFLPLDSPQYKALEDAVIRAYDSMDWDTILRDENR